MAFPYFPTTPVLDSFTRPFGGGVPRTNQGSNLLPTPRLFGTPR